MDELSCISEGDAKSLLLALCSNDEALSRRASKLRESLAARKSRNEPVSGSQRAKKRKADAAVATEPVVKICLACQQPFEEGDEREICRYHDGWLNADYDSYVWEDWDEDTHGAIDSRENQELYPSGFKWSCCSRGGAEAGCKIAKHTTVKRARGHKPGSMMWQLENGRTLYPDVPAPRSERGAAQDHVAAARSIPKRPRRFPRYRDSLNAETSPCPSHAASSRAAHSREADDSDVEVVKRPRREQSVARSAYGDDTRSEASSWSNVSNINTSSNNSSNIVHINAGVTYGFLPRPGHHGYWNTSQVPVYQHGFTYRPSATISNHSNASSSIFWAPSLTIDGNGMNFSMNYNAAGR